MDKAITCSRIDNTTKICLDNSKAAAPKGQTISFLERVPVWLSCKTLACSNYSDGGEYDEFNNICRCKGKSLNYFDGTL